MDLNFGIDKLLFLKENSEEKLKKSSDERGIILDSRIQVKLLSNTLDRYVVASLQEISGNSNLEEVTQKLANNMIEIKNFVNLEVEKIILNDKILEQKLLIHEENRSLISECLREAQEEKEKHSTIIEKMKKGEVDSQSPKQRKLGERPNGLKDMRRAEQQLKLQGKFPE